MESGANGWISSWNGAAITNTQAVVTSLSSSSKVAGHASLFIEWISPFSEKKGAGAATQQGRPEMWSVDLSVSGGSTTPEIKWTLLHRVDHSAKGGEKLFNLKMLKDKEWYESRHCHPYTVTQDQAAGVWRAASRFDAKAGEGRYKYMVTGGAIGVLGSRPGVRGVNCADFVIKVLREAGIQKLGYRLFDRPYRVAS